MLREQLQQMKRELIEYKYWIMSSISPKSATKTIYKDRFNQKLDLNNPKSFNEKLQWLKLNTYYKNPLVTQCADKYCVREFINNLGCKEMLNDLIGVYESAAEIPWKELPEKFVIKCNHGSGYNLICTDKKNFNIVEATKKLNHWMKEDYWRKRAEINYKFIKKEVIIEKYIETEDGTLPQDYKFYCFNGKPEYVLVCTDREVHAKYYFYNQQWELQPYSTDALKVTDDFEIEKPKVMDKAFEYAAKLAKGFPFVRTDFYIVSDKVIFGEMTFTPAGALDNDLYDGNRIFGQQINLTTR